jgi:hypothetical protein
MPRQSKRDFLCILQFRKWFFADTKPLISPDFRRDHHVVTRNRGFITSPPNFPEPSITRARFPYMYIGIVVQASNLYPTISSGHEAYIDIRHLTSQKYKGP